jgi:hypothetical protein
VLVLNPVSVVLVFLKYTLSHTLLNVIVFHIVYVVQLLQFVLVSSVTEVGEPVLVSFTVLPAVLAVKHKYGITGGRTFVVHTYTSFIDVFHTYIHFISEFHI